MALINKTVLVSGAEYFTDKDAINALMDSSIPVDVEAAIKEHEQIVNAFKSAGITVVKTKPPKDLQDGIYVANWGLVRNGKVLVSRLPNKRMPEEPYAKKVFKDLKLEVLELPNEVKSFSGQGDAILCDDVLFCQSPYRTSLNAHQYIKSYLEYKEVLSIVTKPSRWFKYGPKKINKLTGWPDSPTYDIDLAIAAIRPRTTSSPPVIAYCPDVFTRKSRKTLARLEGFHKVLVSKEEALTAFALNLVSTGETVIINKGAPKFKTDLINLGLKVIELDLPELRKGGGSIRCCSLTLS